MNLKPSLRSCTSTLLCCLHTFKPEDGPREPKHVTGYTLELCCVACVLDCLLYKKSQCFANHYLAILFTIKFFKKNLKIL